MCGENYHPVFNEIQVQVDVAVSHSSSTATIRLAALGEDGYFGIQDLTITSAMALPSPPSPPNAPGIWQSGPAFIDSWAGATGWQGTYNGEWVGTSLGVTTCADLGTMLGGA